MTTIDVDFDVYKELTARRASEVVTYNDVIRSLLGLNDVSARRPASEANGTVFKNIHFPDGTLFRATYKGKTYAAEIRNGRWVAEDGTFRKSPSEAAVRITGKNWNGWRFWKCKRPDDREWALMDTLRQPTSLADFALD